MILLLFLALSWAAIRYVLPRMAQGRKPAGEHLRIIERLALEPRRSLYLVGVDGRRAVVSSSEHGLALSWVPAAGGEAAEDL